MTRTCRVGDVTIGPGSPLAIIAGPCTLESPELGLEVGRVLKDVCASLGLSFIFKASFDKANRTSIASPRGPGLASGLEALANIRETLGVPITTDVHLPEQCDAVGAVADMLQIPAFLCRQTDLLLSAAQSARSHGRAVSIKKGQFLSPEEMGGPVRKISEGGCENVLLLERGTFFGYNRLVNDFIGLGDLMELDCSGFTDLGPPPVCFDVTHSTQLPGSGQQTGGRPERGPMLARAATASGVHALFIEAHPNPKEALSDGATQLALNEVAGVLESVAAIRGALRA